MVHILYARANTLFLKLSTSEYWATRNKLKRAPKNAQVIDPFIDEKEPNTNGKDIETVENDSHGEVTIGDDNDHGINLRFNRCYNCRSNSNTVQPLGNKYTHC